MRSLFIFGLTLVFGIYIVGRSPSSATKSSSVQSYSVAEKLAIFDNGTLTTTDASQIDTILTRLASKFPESKVEIGAATIKGQELLAKKNIDMKLCDLLTAMDSTTKDGTLGIKYVEMLAIFVTLEKNNELQP